MRLISLLIALLLSGCVGVVTKHNYTYEEAYKVGKSPFMGWGLFTDFMKGKVVKELTIIVAVSLAAGILLSGCQGAITGHQYTDDEILKIASFSGESIDRVKFALKNPKDVNLTELAKSFERIERARNEIKGLKDE